MKKLLPIFIALLVPFFSSATEDSVSIGAGYISQSYYSYSNGLVKTSTSDWDLAFGIGGFNVAIRTNDGKGVEVYLYPNGDTAAWNNIDTTGLQNWTPRFNNENNWEETAFSDVGKNHPDYGWGVYNSVSHDVIGDSIYIIKTKAGDFKKIVINGMYTNGDFTFTYADLDGSNEMTSTINKKDYVGKNFAYYSIASGTELDLEPLSSEWDVVFSRYMAYSTANGFYPSAGVQTNYYKQSAEARGVDLNNVDWAQQNFVDEIGEIGWDWKEFNMGTFTYDMIDSLTYFVADTNNNVWQMTFTGFDYTIGTYYFKKERVNGVSVQEAELVQVPVTVYPNPANNVVNISLDALNGTANYEIQIFNISGAMVYQNNTTFTGSNNVTLDVANWQKGIYFIKLENNGEIAIKQLIVQ